MADIDIIDNWHDWEIIHDYDEPMGNFSPEVVIATNKGFDMTEELFFGIGDTQWNSKSKKISIKNVQVSRSKKVVYLKNFKLYKISDRKEYKLVFLPNDYEDFFKNQVGFLLDRTNRPIYRVNDLGGLIFEETNDFIIYVKFFFYNVAGRHGKFYIVDDKEDVMPMLNTSIRENELSLKPISINDLDEDKRKKLESLDFKMRLIEVFDSESETSEIEIENVYMIFRAALFKSNVVVNKENGLVKLKNESLIIEF